MPRPNQTGTATQLDKARAAGQVVKKSPLTCGTFVPAVWCSPMGKPIVPVGRPIRPGRSCTATMLGSPARLLWMIQLRQWYVVHATVARVGCFGACCWASCTRLKSKMPRQQLPPFGHCWQLTSFGNPLLISFEKGKHYTEPLSRTNPGGSRTHHRLRCLALAGSHLLHLRTLGLGWHPCRRRPAASDGSRPSGLSARGFSRPGNRSKHSLYRLLGGPDVTFEALMHPHFQQTRADVADQAVVLLIQDTTEIDLSPHGTMSGLGQTGNEKGCGRQTHNFRGLTRHHW